MSGRAGVAQLVEQLTCNEQAVGSSPSSGSSLPRVMGGRVPEGRWIRMSSICSRFAREAGQTMAEYAVVLGIIILGVAIAFTALSGGISNAINNAAKMFGG